MATETPLVFQTLQRLNTKQPHVHPDHFWLILSKTCAVAARSLFNDIREEVVVYERRRNQTAELLEHALSGGHPLACRLVLDAALTRDPDLARGLLSDHRIWATPDAIWKRHFIPCMGPDYDLSLLGKSQADEALSHAIGAEDWKLLSALVEGSLHARDRAKWSQYFRGTAVPCPTLLEVAQIYLVHDRSPQALAFASAATPLSQGDALVRVLQLRMRKSPTSELHQVVECWRRADLPGEQLTSLLDEAKRRIELTGSEHEEGAFTSLAELALSTGDSTVYSQATLLAAASNLSLATSIPEEILAAEESLFEHPWWPWARDRLIHHFQIGKTLQSAVEIQTLASLPGMSPEKIAAIGTEMAREGHAVEHVDLLFAPAVFARHPIGSRQTALVSYTLELVRRDAPRQYLLVALGRFLGTGAPTSDLEPVFARRPWTRECIAAAVDDPTTQEQRIVAAVAATELPSLDTRDELPIPPSIRHEGGVWAWLDRRAGLNRMLLEAHGGMIAAIAELRTQMAQLVALGSKRSLTRDQRRSIDLRFTACAVGFARSASHQPNLVRELLQVVSVQDIVPQCRRKSVLEIIQPFYSADSGPQAQLLFASQG